MMLTQSLKELELYGVACQEQFEEIPPRVEYSLTENGEKLMTALKTLAHWGKQSKREFSTIELKTDIKMNHEGHEGFE